VSGPAIALLAVTDAGRRAAAQLAAALPGARHVAPADLAQCWPGLDAAVFFLATGATVRLVAPLLGDKHTDPGVVCVDEARRYAVALTGGHAGGANALARRVAALLGAEAVITTASDAIGTTGLDEVVELLGATVEGDLAAAGAALLDGALAVANPLAFPLPALDARQVDAPQVDAPQVGADAEGRARGAAAPGVRHTLVVTDRLGPAGPALTRLVAPTLVVGVGSARGVPPEAVEAVLRRIETDHGFDRRAVRAYASLDLKADEAGILAAIAPAPLRTHPAGALAAVEVPNPSEVVRAEVGTPSVAEAAALLSARELAPGAAVELVVPKIVGDGVTAAVARIRPRGRLALVGLGPGAVQLRVPQASAELRRASVVVGLDQYLDQVRDLLRPGTEVRASGLGQEEQRAAEAVRLAAAGRAVALVGSGDVGVYAMASPALQRAGADIEVVVVPGVTAALAAAALLGAPLGHDHVLISLSDLHTPWEVIERRVCAAAEADLVACFYNPRSRDRHWQLGAALDVLRVHRPPATPVGAVRQAGRPGQRVWTRPLSTFDPAEVDMLTTVVVGSSATRMVAGRMVTPRGYRWS